MSLRHLTLVLLLSGGLCVGQEPGSGEAEQPPPPPPEGPKSPREVFKEFDSRIRDYAKTEDRSSLERAGKLFDFEGIPTPDQPALGAQAARDLAAFLNRCFVPPTFISGTPEEASPYTYEVKDDGKVMGKLVFTRTDEGIWQFSAVTRDESSVLESRVRDLPRHWNAVDLPARTSIYTFFRDMMPQGMRQRLVLLDHWQWLGLLVLILLGLLVERIVSWVVTVLQIRFFERRQVPLRELDRGPGRPVGQVAMAGLWMLGLQFLVLPSGTYAILMGAARVVMMLAAVWAVWRVVDVMGDFFQGKALLTKSRLDDQLVPMVRRALKIFVGVAGILWIAHNLDFNIKTLLAGLGLGGLAFALAAKDTVNNLFGSLTIMLDRPFYIGDWIVIGDIEGTVENVGFRSCRVRTFYNSVITFPNSMLITAAVDNMGERRYRRISTTLGVAYDTPPEKIEAFLEGIRELIRRHPYTRKDYYHVYLNGFGDSSLNILLYVFVETPEWGTELREKQRLFLDILRLAHELQVEFAFPTRTLQLIQSQMPAHPDVPSSPEVAHQRGRRLARSIVETYTGDEVPPPVQILPPDSGRGSEAEADGEG